MNLKQYIIENIERIDEAKNFIVHADSEQVLLASTWGGGRIDVVNHWKARGYQLVAVCAPAAMPNKLIEYGLMSLTSSDKVYVQKYPLKAGEYIFRVLAPSIHQLPLVKVNVKIGYIYFLTPRANSGEIDVPEFETRGTKLRWLRHAKLALIKESEVCDSCEQITEMNKDTVRQYIKHAAHDKGVHEFKKTVAGDNSDYHERKVTNRELGIKRAISKLTKH